MFNWLRRLVSRDQRQSHKQNRKKTSRSRPRVEHLEARDCPAVNVWQPGILSDLQWGTASNWSTGTVPGYGDDVVFNGTSGNNSCFVNITNAQAGTLQINSSWTKGLIINSGCSLNVYAWGGATFNYTSSNLDLANGVGNPGRIQMKGNAALSFSSSLPVNWLSGEISGNNGDSTNILALYNNQIMNIIGGDGGDHRLGVRLYVGYLPDNTPSLATLNLGTVQNQMNDNLRIITGGDVGIYVSSGGQYSGQFTSKLYLNQGNNTATCGNITTDPRISSVLQNLGYVVQSVGNPNATVTIGVPILNNGQGANPAITSVVDVYGHLAVTGTTVAAGYSWNIVQATEGHSLIRLWSNAVLDVAYGIHMEKGVFQTAELANQQGSQFAAVNGNIDAQGNSQITLWNGTHIGTLQVTGNVWMGGTSLLNIMFRGGVSDLLRILTGTLKLNQTTGDTAKVYFFGNQPPPGQYNFVQAPDTPIIGTFAGYSDQWAVNAVLSKDDHNYYVTF